MVWKIENPLYKFIDFGLYHYAKSKLTQRNIKFKSISTHNMAKRYAFANEQSIDEINDASPRFAIGLDAMTVYNDENYDDIDCWIAWNG